MGIFGKKRRSSTESTTGNPVVINPASSTIHSSATDSTTSTRPASLRKPPIRPQATFERIVPPPVQSNEIDLLREQILDLERAFSDRDLFDFLLADIDRNRLTQIVTIFADTGRYSEMQNAMELSEKLDDLIRRRLDETHEQQRRTLIVSQSENETDIRAIISEAEATDIASLSEHEIQNRISYFEFHFYRFQDCDFTLLLRLSGFIETFRKALRDIESRGSMHTVTPTEITQPQPDTMITADVEPEPARSIQVIAEAAQSDEEEWETFTPGLESVVNPPPTNIDYSSIYGPIDIAQEASLVPITDITEPTVADDMQEPVNVAEIPTPRNIETHAWEQFHDSSAAVPVPINLIVESDPEVEIYRIASSCEPNNTPHEAIALRESRIKSNVLNGWLRVRQDTQMYLQYSKQLSQAQLCRLLIEWKSLAQRTRMSRDEAEKALKISVLQILHQHCNSMVEKSDSVVRVYNMELARSAFRSWVHCSHDEKDLVSTCNRKRDLRCCESVFSAWKTLARLKQNKISYHLRVRDLITKRMAMTAWRSHLHSLASKAEEFHSRSLLRILATFIEECKKSKAEAATHDKKMNKLRMGSVFAKWKSVHERRRRVAESVLNICASNIWKNFNILKKNCANYPSLEARNAAIKLINDVINVACLRQKRAMMDVFVDSNPGACTPRGQLELFSPSMHKSPIVQYYSISDPEEARQETPPTVGPIEDLKQATNDIIVKTQIFLSQRRLKSVSPPIESPTNLDHSRKVANWLENHKRSSDNYFTDFERKWAIEEQRWHL